MQRFVLAPNPRGFNRLSAGSVVLGPVVRQEQHGQGERDAVLVVASEGRAAGDRGKILFKDTPPMMSPSRPPLPLTLDNVM